MPNKKIIHYLIAAMGVALMVFGFLTHKIGAAIVGLIVAAVNIHRLSKLNNSTENK